MNAQAKPDPPIPLEEWQEEMQRRGKLDAKFVCPVCKNEASPNDWRAAVPDLKDPGRAAQECIGRALLPHERRRAFSTEPEAGAPERPCDYAGFGLIDLCPVRVEMPGGKVISVFAFA